MVMNALFGDARSVCEMNAERGTSIGKLFYRGGKKEESCKELQLPIECHP
jgi:hypothetical protein